MGDFEVTNEGSVGSFPNREVVELFGLEGQLTTM